MGPLERISLNLWRQTTMESEFSEKDWNFGYSYTSLKSPNWIPC